MKPDSTKASSATDDTSFVPPTPWREALAGEDFARLAAELEGVPGRSLRDRLAALAETGGSDALRAFLSGVFPSQLEGLDNLPRRDFLRLAGSSLAVCGLGACTRQPDETIVPWARSPELTIPGKPRYFATAMTLWGSALGLLVESHMGRPTKVEGNPDHPSSKGATDVFAQSAILSLYDPDRSSTVLGAGQIRTWEAFVDELGRRMNGFRAKRGEGLHVLLNETLSPTLAAQLESLQRELPQMRVHRWQPIHRDLERQGALLAFGRDVVPSYRLERAAVVLSLDADFLASDRGGVCQARDFAKARRVRADTSSMSRLYAIESAPNPSGAMADHRLAVKPSEVEGLARALAKELGLDVDAPTLGPERARFVQALAADLSAHRRTSAVVAGRCQSPAVHALAHALNRALENHGQTVLLHPPLEPDSRSVTDSMRQLVDAMRAGSVEGLFLLGGNPVFDAPRDLEFSQSLTSVPFRVHLSSHEDETSRVCHWHLPEAHFLESWSDTRSLDGTASLVQPLIAPLYGGKTTHELVAAMSGEAGVSAHDLLKRFWRARAGLDEGPEFDRFWQTALHDGLVPGSAPPPLDVALLPRLDIGPATPSIPGIEIALRPDPSVYDGRFANNGWLQELPRPLTRMAWDNALWLAAEDAAQLDVENGDVVRVTAGERSIAAPVWIVPGHPQQTATLHLGYGRTKGGELARGVGVDAYGLRSSHTPWTVPGALLEPTGASTELVSVQDHASMEGRDILRVATFDRFRANPEALGAHHGAHDPNELSMYPEVAYEGNAWGMVIDLNACIGCNACMIACQSENNIPVVGKTEVGKGREMHWLRIDRYYEEEAETGQLLALHQPVPCMHCENAPCEVVCPVGATVHSSEGLNEMVYNRCIGTRYCSNNCPYKVRRFNFFPYADYETESLKLGNNPDVTVRSRGVMEKCTYCVQRISSVRIEAKKDGGRAIVDGEVTTACQQACPTQAIAFGNLNDAASVVARERAQPHHYGLLEELGTRPRTTYLAKLRNPNPDLRPE